MKPNLKFMTQSHRSQAADSASSSPHLDAAILLKLKPILDAGDVAISHRGQFQDLTVKIAMALGVACDNYKSEIIHAQYMELGVRILARIAENVASASGNAGQTLPSPTLLSGWGVISESCDECGAKLATRLLDHEPTEAEKRDCEQILGGMHCISTRVVKMEMNSAPVITESA